MAGVAIPAAPAAPAGASSAQNALYFATAAELAHAYEHTLASDQEALSDDQAAYRANQGKLNAAEPTAQTNIRNRANEEGLATSGIEGQRADQQTASFARSMGALTTTRQQDMDKINRGMTEAGESYADKLKTNLADRESEVQKEAVSNAEKDPTLGATPAATVAPAMPVISKITQQPNSPGNKVAVRRAAARKVMSP